MGVLGHSFSSHSQGTHVTSCRACPGGITAGFPSLSNHRPRPVCSAAPYGCNISEGLSPLTCTPHTLKHRDTLKEPGLGLPTLWGVIIQEGNT